MGVLLKGEDALVGLGREGHAVALEPAACVLVVEDMEQPLQQTVATGIDLRKVSDLPERVGAVAPTATAHLDLAEYALASLEDGDIHLGHFLFQVYGQKETGGSAANHRFSAHLCGGWRVEGGGWRENRKATD